MSLCNNINVQPTPIGPGDGSNAYDAFGRLRVSQTTNVLDIKHIISKEGFVVDEVTGGTATFTPGSGAQYATPFAFGKSSRATKASKKLGFKKLSRPKRPSHTKGFDYL